MSGLDSVADDEVHMTELSPSSPVGGNCKLFKLCVMGDMPDDKYCNNSARSRSDKFDSGSEAPELWVPPANRRCSDNNWSAEALRDSMASSHDARERTLLLSKKFLGSLDACAIDWGSGVVGLLNRLRRDGLLLFEEPLIPPLLRDVVIDVLGF